MDIFTVGLAPGVCGRTLIFLMNRQREYQSLYAFNSSDSSRRYGRLTLMMDDWTCCLPSHLLATSEEAVRVSSDALYMATFDYFRDKSFILPS